MADKFDNTIKLPASMVESIDLVIKYQNKQLEKEVIKMINN
jgi:hypothetical protein